MAFITRLFKSSKWLIVPLMLPAFQNVAAEGIDVSRAEARITDGGQLSVSSRFQTELPDQLKQALRRGVPLNFTLGWQLSAPTVASYRFKFDQLIGDDSNIYYKLTFHPLTNRYRVTVGAFSTDYDTLDAALRAIGAVANWKVLHKGTLSGTEARETKAEIRLLLSTSKLPKPFQINALTSKNWHLDSGWKPLNIIGNK
ncbi:DUF4390 domain-containing protein [Neisseria cinerea]|jgi:hypothetical protein|uniref:DUF4390 domain-containing protein n=2 Tax=Neisseria cinerea TaxID=483 RepID=A0A7T3BM01_NEICI|nr:DUF4390 domain-containing protein [Neisseria cinerea]RKV65895.1 MAG: DUF4390 domain-containing protein [Neisseria sp.]EEZ71018.1 hypothetical protein NEICINOT_04862 [Neisseria cinerea ATCC 14685]MCD2071434.1 DUF4390 domain-containing protein [Neisseria cinerea]QPT38072.1 DUF4390 domain-containing protein [Neisseria cinerea]SQF84138.1 Uncharacterised protein [Neisseria cinerea]